MTPEQQQAFLDAAGFHAGGICFDIKLFVGGISVVCSVFILMGLMHLLNTNSAWDRMIFLISIMMLSFILMLILTYCA